jgi:hypothetical protein
VKTSWNVLPDANMRVASELGVSAEMSALLEALLVVDGDLQLIDSPALTFAEMLVVLGPLVGVPAAAELPEPLEPLLEAAAFPELLAPLAAEAPLALPLLVAVPLDPPPPPPQPASTNNREVSNNDWNFIGEAKKYEHWPKLRHDAVARVARGVTAGTECWFDFSGMRHRGANLMQCMPAGAAVSDTAVSDSSASRALTAKAPAYRRRRATSAALVHLARSGMR